MCCAYSRQGGSKPLRRSVAAWCSIPPAFACWAMNMPVQIPSFDCGTIARRRSGERRDADGEVTKAYRRQMSRHHPDKLLPDGLPESIISASILSADFPRLGEEVKAVLAARADWIHFDVMDNHYVPNLTVGPMVCEALRKAGVTATIDVHLMVTPVDALAADFANAGASRISFHPEATQHVDRTIEHIRDSGCAPGLVFNPATSLNWLDYLIDKIDTILVMSVNPGFGGQKFIPQSLGKLAEARARIEASGRDI